VAQGDLVKGGPASMSTSSPGCGDICGHEAELSGLSFFIFFRLPPFSPKEEIRLRVKRSRKIKIMTSGPSGNKEGKVNKN
jgi:hypothetical protein